MKKGFILLLLAAIVSCKGEKDYKPSFTTATADTLLTDSISIRALAIDGDKAWYGGSNGKYGFVSLGKGTDFFGVIAQDTLLPEFRSLAVTQDGVFLLNAGTPAMLYKVAKDGRSNKMVWGETGPSVFYDSMQFYNDKEGIAMGDPTDGCLSIVTTSNGGDNWSKRPCGNMPPVVEGEAAFAASNTNIVIKGDNIWLVSGGKRSRIYFSPDKGKTWKAYATPIVQGTEMSGMFSADFYDDKIGFAVGGDYEKPKSNTGNKILTADGGKTWEVVGEGTGFGYASCVQFVPESKGNELITCGPSGVYYSYDRGATWKKIHDDKDLHTLRFADPKTIIAAGQNKIIRLKLQ